MIADIELPADLPARATVKITSPTRRAFLTLVIEHRTRLLLQHSNPLPNLRTGEQFLERVPKRNPLPAIHAKDVLLPLLQLPHRDFTITHRSPAMRTNIMPKPHHLLSFLKKVLMHVPSRITVTEICKLFSPLLPRDYREFEHPANPFF